MIVINEEFNEFNYFVVWRAYGRITISFWYLRQTNNVANRYTNFISGGF